MFAKNLSLSLQKRDIFAQNFKRACVRTPTVDKKAHSQTLVKMKLSRGVVTSMGAKVILEFGVKTANPWGVYC